MGSGTSSLSRSSSASSERPRLPAAFMEIANDIESRLMPLEDLQEVPDYIKNNRIWSLLRDRIKSVHLLCISESMAVLLLLLDDNTQMVIKGCNSWHTCAAETQLAAERKIAKCFPCHPLMATVIGSCEETADADGGTCLVLPYAGVSFATIMGHPDWQGKLTQQERTDVFSELAAHTMTVHAILQNDGGRHSFIYRDTKPDNVTFDPSTGQIKLIDYGLAMRSSTIDYHSGFTVGRFTPEMVHPRDDYHAFYTDCGRCCALNLTTDVFLTGQQGLEMICGLPPQLQPPASPWDMSDKKATDALLLAHHRANYARLIRGLNSRTARDFLLQAMAVDPEKRLTPAAALWHRFLQGRADEVEARVLDTLPAHTEQVCHILDLLAPLQDQPGVFLAAHHHQQRLQQQQQCSEWPAPDAATRAQSCSDSTYEPDYWIRSSSMDVAAREASGNDDPQDSAQLVDGLMTVTSCSVTSSTGGTASCSTTLKDYAPTELEEGHMTSTSSITAGDASAVVDAPGQYKKNLAGRLLGKLKLLRSTSGDSRSKKLFGGCKAAVSGGDGKVSALQLSTADAVVVVVEPLGVAVPGVCGMRWWGGISRIAAGSKIGGCRI